jgi:hypothetical protein
MGAVPQSYAQTCAVPEQGTEKNDNCATLLQIPVRTWSQRSKSRWTMPNSPDTIFVTAG